jgi:formylglycine-generating enzyme required for sulfatase activity
MKYELSQGQYTEFLNTLTRHQQKSRVASDISTNAVTNIYVMTNSPSSVYRSRITCPSTGNGTTQPVIFSCDRPDRACNYLSWMDGCAYVDWAGLRPMTELELEKANRGPLTPVAGEYAWGSTSFITAFAISGIEDGTEYITTTDANVSCYNITYTGGDGGQGPLRCGIHARLSTTRVQAGATYFGIMDMSGNLYERCVTVGNPTGRLFDGLHGDGFLSINGNSDVTNWPGLVAGEITGAYGANNRMGAFADGVNYFCRVSDRIMANNNNNTRNPQFSIRGVRTSEVVTLKPNMNKSENKNNNQ